MKSSGNNLLRSKGMQRKSLLQIPKLSKDFLRKSANQEIFKKPELTRKNTNPLLPTNLALNIEGLDVFKKPTVIIKNIIKVEILENHGNRDFVSCSEIDVLNSKNIVIPVSKIVQCPNPETTIELKKLVNNKLSKNESEIWKESWNGKPIQLLLIIESDETPTSIRIWNGGKDLTAHIKSINVYLNDTLVSTAEIVSGMGKKIEIRNAKEEVPVKKMVHTPSFIDKNFPMFSVDNFGVVPILLTRQIDIEILSGYSKKDIIGLNGLEFFTVDGTILTDDYIKNVQCTGCESLATHTRLLKTNKNTDAVYDMWVSQKIDEKIVLSFEFEKPINLALIIIYNYMSIELDHPYQTRKIRILQNNNPIQQMTLLQNKGETNIWITDVPKIRRKIRKVIYELQNNF